MLCEVFSCTDGTLMAPALTTTALFFAACYLLVLFLVFSVEPGEPGDVVPNISISVIISVLITGITWLLVSVALQYTLLFIGLLSLAILTFIIAKVGMGINERRRSG
jgi:hypothetical protein